MNTWVDVAVITGTKTLDGRLVVRTTLGLPFLLSEGQEVFFVPPVLDVPRKAIVEHIEHGTGNDYLVHFSSVRDKTTAKKLIDCHILLNKNDLNARTLVLAETSLASFRVIDEEKGYIGVVTDLKEMPGQVLLQVDANEEKQHFIPFVDEFIVDIQAEEKCIKVHVPAGLLEL